MNYLRRMWNQVVTRGACVVGLLLLLAACASPARVRVERPPEFDLAAYRTFGFLPPSGSAPAGEHARVGRLLARTHELAAERLDRLGLRRVSMTEADLVVVIHGETIPEWGMEQWMVKNPATNPRGANWSATAYLEVDALRFDERVLRMEVYDNRTKELVWVGWSRSTRRAPWPEEEVVAQARAIVNAFPLAAPPGR